MIFDYILIALITVLMGACAIAPMFTNKGGNE